jgi:hypothetical protein
VSTFQSVRGADAHVRQQNDLPTPAYRIRNPSPKKPALLISDRKEACHSDRREESLFNKACHPDRSGGLLLSEESQIRPATWEILLLDTVPQPGGWRVLPARVVSIPEHTLCVFDLAGTMPPRHPIFVQSGKGRDRKRTDFSAKRNGTDPGFSAWRIRAPVDRTGGLSNRQSLEPAVCRTGRQIVGRKLPYADAIAG